MLLVTWCVVKEEDGLGISPSEPLEDLDRIVDLGKQVVGFEPSVPVLPRPEDDPGITVEE